jgi:hypothetical protein
MILINFNLKKIYFYGFFLLLSQVCFGQKKVKNDPNFLAKLMATRPEQFGEILKNPEKYRVQIVYTQIDRDEQNRPKFKQFTYRLNDKAYFYPASTVKFPACLLALEKINQLNIKGLSKESIMQTNSSLHIAKYPNQYTDATASDSMPSIEHYIKKILLVSDNDAFNRLYEWVGQEFFNKNLWLKGCPKLRIAHRLLMPLSSHENRWTNSINFLNRTPKGYDTIWQQAEMYSALDLKADTSILLGKGYIRNNTLVNEGFEFKYKNYFPIDEQQQLLKGVMFPDAAPKHQRFALTTADYDFLYKYMSMSPLESKSPHYPDADSAGAWDSYCKFLMFGDNKKPMPKHIRIFNKVGDAYGFLIDNAYIVDFEKNIEFFLSAVIYCNSDEIFNDDKYDYDKIGFPFLANLGRLVYDFEAKRERKRQPDLSRFRFDY